MSEHTPPSGAASVEEEPLMDALLREAVPEIKLALGDLIDRENQRALPDRYARILPETVLLVTLRPDAAGALRPVAAELERELTDSCMRHGSLYDRAYRVRLREAGQAGAALFRVSVQRPGAPEPAPPTATDGGTIASPPPAAAREPDEPPSLPPPPAPAHPHVAPFAAVAPPVPPPSAGPPPLPAVDPDATRLDGPEAPAAPAFPAGRFALAVEDEDGTERAVHPVPGAVCTVGRASDHPELRSDVQLEGAPHVSRRQLALVWAPEEGEDAFTAYNLGLNPVHVAGREVPGANWKGPVTPDALHGAHGVRLAPGDALRIGQHGPVLRLREVPPPEEPLDPDATRFG